MIQTANFKPKFFEIIQHYNKSLFASDLMAGVIVGIVALPLAIAFAIASGVSPEKGIITAVVAGFIISLLGGQSTNWRANRSFYCYSVWHCPTIWP